MNLEGLEHAQFHWCGEEMFEYFVAVAANGFGREWGGRQSLQR
jgi:hypothetical protein